MLIAGSPARPAEELVAEARRRTMTRLSPRERRGEAAAGAGFLVAAVAILAFAPPLRELDLVLTASLTLAYAVANRTHIEVGAGYLPPTQLLLVPMLFLLPVNAVPLLIAVAHLLGQGPDYLRARRHPERLAHDLGDAWYCIGPVLVFALAGISDPELSQWPLYLAALGAQFALDFASSAFREGYELGVPTVQSFRDMAWIVAVDATLAPIGFLAVLSGRPYAWLLALPALPLLHVLSRERTARLSKALELRTVYQGTTLLLGRMIDSGDEYTGNHSRSVLPLCLAVCDRLRLDARRRQLTEYAALLHDVGKISVPAEVLNKPGPLSAAEWTVMKEHTVEGERMLRPIGGVMSTVAVIVRASHERWDGRGYPDRLAREAIPLEARIVSTCDAFHAMTTDRPYRQAMPVSAAIDLLRDHAGTQFDPGVVAALVDVLSEGHEPDAPTSRSGVASDPPRPAAMAGSPA